MLSNPPLSSPAPSLLARLRTDLLPAALVLAIMGCALHFDTRLSGIMPLFWATGVALVAATWLLPRTAPVWLARFPGQGGYVVALLALLIVSYQWSLSPDASFKLTWVYVVVLLAYVLLASAAAQVRQLVWLGIVLGALGLAVVSCWDYFSRDVRASWPLDDPNNYASLMYLVFLPWFHLTLASGWRGGAALGWRLLPTVLVIVTVFASESRAGLGIIAVAFLCWWLLAAFRGLPKGALAWHTVTAAVTLTACIGLLGTSGIAPGGDNTLSGGVAIRGVLLTAAWEMYLERPLLGVGLNMFPAFYAARRPLIDQETAGRFVHNDYMQLLLEGGPLLLLALLAVGAWSVWGLWRASRRPLFDPGFGAFGYLLAACALLAHAAVNFVFYRFSLPLLLALLLALASTALAQASAEPAPAPAALQRIRRGVLVALIGAWGAWLYLVLDVAVAGVIEGQDDVPFTAAWRADAESVQEFAQLAQGLNDRRGLPFLADAALHARRAATTADPQAAERALAGFRASLAVDPWNTQTYLEFYRFQSMVPLPVELLAEHEQANNLLLQAIALDRQYVPALDALLSTAEATPALHRQLLLQFVEPWFEIIARKDSAAAQHYSAQLAPIVGEQHHAAQQELLRHLEQARLYREAHQH